MVWHDGEGRHVTRFNPNHPVTQAIDDQWHKLLALVLVKLGQERVVLTEEDVDAIAARPGGTVVVAHSHRDSIELRIVTEAEGEALARKAGGLPA